MSSARKLPTSYNTKTYGTASRDYSSLNTWESATQGDLVSAAKGEVLDCYDDEISYDDRTEIDGSTTSSSYFRVIRAAPGEGHDGTPNNGVFFDYDSASNLPIFLKENYCQVQDLIVKRTGNLAVENSAIQTLTGTNHKIIACIVVDSVSSGAGQMLGIKQKSADSIAVLCASIRSERYNYQFSHATPNIGRCYNCISIDPANHRGFNSSGDGDNILKNCLSENSPNDDFDNSAGSWGSGSVNNASSDSTADEGGLDAATAVVDATFNFVNAGSDDYHLHTDDTDAEDAGADLSADSFFAFDDDIDGELFDTWDIGFDEPVPAAAGQTASITEGAKASDTFAAIATGLASIGEGAKAGDTDVAIATALAAVTDGAKAGDSQAALATAQGSISDGAKAGDSESALAAAIASITEGAKGGDSESGLAAAIASITEGAKGGDTDTGGAASLAALTDGALAGDLFATFQAIANSITEGAKAGESWVGDVQALAAIVEGAKSGDSFSALVSAASTLLEGAKAGDTFVATTEGAISAAIAEGSKAGDTFAAAVVALAALAEGAKAGDTQTAAAVAAGAISDGAKASDLFAPQASLIGTITEGAVAGDGRVYDGVDLDGVADYYSRGSDLIGNANSKTGIFYGVIRLDGSNASLLRFLHNTSGFFDVHRASNNKIAIIGKSAVFSDILSVRSLSTYTSSSALIRILASWDLNSGVSHLYIDDVDDLEELINSNDPIAYVRPSWGVGATVAGTDLYDGVFGIIYFAPGQYLNFSVEANRRKFYTDNLSQTYLGSDGALPTGTAPLIYMDGGARVFGVNKGTGGAFTENGSPSTVSNFIQGPGWMAQATALASILEGAKAGDTWTATAAAVAALVEGMTAGDVFARVLVDVGLVIAAITIAAAIGGTLDVAASIEAEPDIESAIDGQPKINLR